MHLTTFFESTNLRLRSLQMETLNLICAPFSTLLLTRLSRHLRERRGGKSVLVEFVND